MAYTGKILKLEGPNINTGWDFLYWVVHKNTEFSYLLQDVRCLFPSFPTKGVSLACTNLDNISNKRAYFAIFCSHSLFIQRFYAPSYINEASFTTVL